jgi:hypothetical protein
MNTQKEWRDRDINFERMMIMNVDFMFEILKMGIFNEIELVLEMIEVNMYENERMVVGQIELQLGQMVCEQIIP